MQRFAKLVLLGLVISGLPLLFCGRTSEPVPPSEEKVDILVTRHQINGGELIYHPMTVFVKVAVPRREAPPDAISKFEEIRGRRLRHGRSKGDHITFANFYDRDAFEIPEGHHLVGLTLEKLPLPKEQMAGKRFDLMWTCRMTRQGVGCRLCLLRDVLIVAADDYRRGDDDERVRRICVVMALDTEERNTLNLGRELGPMELVFPNLIRPGNDSVAASILHSFHKKPIHFTIVVSFHETGVPVK